MSEKGQIVVPKEIRDRHGFGNGSAFAVLETKDGALSFRPGV
jgi:AbrB family looped-hinge helix DNA binding protein